MRELTEVKMSTPVPEMEPQRQFYYMEVAKEYVRQLEEKKGRKLTFHVSTFGCQMNARDSEKLTGILETIGYVETDTEEADFVIYNTCTVRENANNKVYGRLGYLNGFKKKDHDMMIALCGCMMQEEKVVEKIRSSYRFVDLIFGTHNIYKFAELLVQALEADRMVVDVWKDTDKIVEDLPVERKYSFKSGVNIMFGCNNFCSYCIVPYVRGRERSRKPEDILNEIKELAKEGYREITLLGQNVNSYKGGENYNFANLLEDVDKIEGIEVIRFVSPHPKDFTDDVIDVISKSKKISRLIHVPLQSGSTNVLKEMNRKYTKEQYLDLIKRIRDKIPDVVFSTDIIVGFPGETEEDFEDTIDVVKQVNFEQIFMFIYSRRVGTRSDKMENQIPEEIKHKRFDRLKQVFEESVEENNKKYVGTTQKILVEGHSKNNQDMLTGRTDTNKVVIFEGPEELIGKIINIKIVSEHKWYLKGEV